MGPRCYARRVDEHRFDAGRVSLDLLATLGNRCEERLPGPEALRAWLSAAGLPVEPGGIDASGLDRARALRSALFRIVDGELHGVRAGAGDVEMINAAAAVPAPVPRLSLDGAGLRCEWGAWTLAEVLGHIARDAVDVLTGPQRALLRECAAEDCSGIYVDASRARTRRWCSSARCGNRARVAAHRARRNGGTEQSAA